MRRNENYSKFSRSLKCCENSERWGWQTTTMFISLILLFILCFALAIVLGIEARKHDSGECEPSCDFCKTEQRRDAKLVKKNTHTIIVKDER